MAIFGDFGTFEDDFMAGVRDEDIFQPPARVRCEKPTHTVLSMTLVKKQQLASAAEANTIMQRESDRAATNMNASTGPGCKLGKAAGTTREAEGAQTADATPEKVTNVAASDPGECGQEASSSSEKPNKASENVPMLLPTSPTSANPNRSHASSKTLILAARYTGTQSKSQAADVVKHDDAKIANVAMAYPGERGQEAGSPPEWPKPSSENVSRLLPASPTSANPNRPHVSSKALTLAAGNAGTQAKSQAADAVKDDDAEMAKSSQGQALDKKQLVKYPMAPAAPKTTAPKTRRSLPQVRRGKNQAD